ncbi:MAG: hypothetical protein ACRD6W_04345 [Nitrososphaerales archaeon]
MDANKLARLKEIDFHVPKTCGLCVHSSFAAPSGEWGECMKHNYEHLKHTENCRHLSIYRGGTCNQFEVDSRAVAKLGRFAEFVK